MDHIIGKVHETTISGMPIQYWSDFTERATFAKNVQTAETKRISAGSYISKDLTARKAIAAAYGLKSFRK